MVFTRRRIVAAGVVLGGFHERVEVEDKGFKVLRTLVQFPDLLVAASLIVQHADDDILIDGLAATCSIL